MLRNAIMFFILILSASSVFAENMIEDSSFELGIDRATTGNLFIWEAGRAFQGSHYAIVRGENAYFRTKKMDELPSQYTFSVYMRSSKPGAKAVLRMGETRWKASKKEVQLTGEWKRYSLTADLKPYTADPTIGKNNIFGCWIENPDGVTIDVDCAQWEKGTLSPYAMKSKPCVAANTVKYANIFFDNEELEYSVGASNPEAQAEDYLCKIMVVDQFGKILKNQEEKFSLQPREALLRNFILKAPKYGFFKVKTTLYNSKSQLLDSHEMHMARVGKREDGKFHPDSFFGVCLGPNSSDPAIMQQQWNVYTGTGARWSRVFINWMTAEPNKNVYNWNTQFKDQNINEAYARKMCQMLVVSSIYHRKQNMPAWGIDNEASEKAGFPFPKEKDFLEFIRIMVERYKGKINIWEILNEPYLIVDTGGSRLTGDVRERYLNEVFEMQQKMFKIFKELDPAADAIVNVNGKGQLEEKQVYFESMLKKGLMDNVDGVSWHFYRGMFPEEKKNEITKTMTHARQSIEKQAKRKSPLYFCNTESANCSNDFFDDENNQYGEYNQMMNPMAFGFNKSELDAAVNAVRATIIEISLGMKISFWFAVGDITDYKAYNVHTMLKDHWRSPKIIYPAYNAMTRMLDETKPLGKLNVGEKMQAHAFQKGGSVVVPYWYLKLEEGLAVGKLEVDASIPIEKLYDFMGNSIDIEKENGKILIPFGKAPNYLVCSLSNLPVIETMLKNGALRDFAGETNISVTLGSAEGLPDIVTKIQNSSSNELSGAIRIARTPPTLTLSTTKVMFKNIEAMKSGSQRFPVKAVADCDAGEIVGIAQINDEKMIDFKKDTSLFTASQTTEEIQIDGDDRDWNLNNNSIKLDSENRILNKAQKAKNMWKGRNDLSCEIWSRWDNQMLYFLVKAKDDIIVQDLGTHFMGDCVKLFFDCDTVKDMENIVFNEDDIQLCFVPSNGSQEGIMSLISANKGLTKDGIKFASRKTQDGYVMEIGIPAATLMHRTFTSGTVLGFNAAIDDRDAPGTKIKTEMIWTGSDDKTWAFTDRLGYIILK